MKKNLKVMLLSAALLGSPNARADGIGDIVTGVLGGLTSGGGLMSVISLIPGLNMLAGIGPVMDLLKNIPGFDTLLSSIPGLGPLLNLITGMQGGANMGPLTDQINQLQKWMSTAQTLRKSAENLLRPTNYNDFASGVSSLLQAAGVQKVITPAQFKSDPQGAAKAAIDALSDQQRNILSKLNKAASLGEADAIRAQADGVQQLKARAQRSADNAETMQKTTGLVSETQDRAQDAITYSDRTARAIKDAKKVEDSTRLLGSAMLENLRVSATNSAALTAARANNMTVEVAQAETLGQMLSEMQQQRLEKAAAIQNALEQQRTQSAHAADRLGTLTKNLTDGMDRSLSASSLKGVDLLGGSTTP